MTVEDSQPLVTAVIPVYNHEKYVEESIRSVIGQTYGNVELIVIDDGSRDGSHEKVLGVLEECRRRFARCEYIRRENRGLSATLNEALEMAKGKYFSGLASDDIALPKKFERLVRAMEESGPEYAAAFGNALFIDDSGEELHLGMDGKATRETSGQRYGNFLDFHTRRRGIEYRTFPLADYRTLLAGNYLPAMANVVRTDAIKESGGWSPDNLLEDWELWLKLAKKYEFIYVDEPVAGYRLHGSNATAVNTHNLMRAAVVLLSREQAYCAEAGLSKEWENSVNMQLVCLLRNRQFPWKKKMAMLIRCDALSLARYVMERIKIKCRRWFSGFRTTA